ncbi:hypothetical protein DFH08DRAFT_821260 [Mycena albidolilacea]|uniref:Copper amine oxidase catalytic domain-containing protein n=1 Tax=Mycena albidolilacea TaxID=1033008 RepID=A0AAD6ZAJ4_9AGAR|nr:hypothetical protein DFH08DRAFT_821260 [Mycena albidolilacea]
MAYVAASNFRQFSPAGSIRIGMLRILSPKIKVSRRNTPNGLTWKKPYRGAREISWNEELTESKDLSITLELLGMDRTKGELGSAGNFPDRIDVFWISNPAFNPGYVSDLDEFQKPYQNSSRSDPADPYTGLVAWQFFRQVPVMLVPVILFLAGSLSSAAAGPHARLKSSKNWAKKARFLEVMSSESSPPSSSTAFNPVAVAIKPNIFDSLTDDEAVGLLIVPYAIISQLTAPGLGDNAIEMVDLVQPNKTGKRHSFFVGYLDNGGPAPDRFAVARIAFGATEEVIERYTVPRAIDYLFVGQPYVQEFVVGPLPISNKTETLFALDGSIETIVRASGYIQSAYSSIFWNFREWFVTSFAPRVDMDILGTDNTFVKHRIVPAQVKYPWANKTRSTMCLVRERVENEDQAKLFWPQNGADMFLVENSDMLNKYGEPRGYRIAPSRGGAGMHLTIENRLYLIPGESLNQTDIVVSACIMYHTQEIYQTLCSQPHNRLSSSLHVGFYSFLAHFVFITEFSDNYLLNDASRATRQMVRVDYNSSGVQLVKNFGGEMPSGLAGANLPNLFDYAGDVAVRKFPYNPLHPFNDNSIRSLKTHSRPEDEDEDGQFEPHHRQNLNV